MIGRLDRTVVDTESDMYNCMYICYPQKVRSYAL
jgi:hypothetical protein